MGMMLISEGFRMRSLAPIGDGLDEITLVVHLILFQSLRTVDAHSVMLFR